MSNYLKIITNYFLLFFIFYSSLLNAQEIHPHHCEDLEIIKTDRKHSTQILFQNNLNSPVEVNRIEAGKTVKYSTLQKNDTCTLSSFLYDKWVITSKGACLLFFVPESEIKMKAIIKDDYTQWNNELKPIDCYKENTLKSIKGTDKASLFIMNRTGLKLKVYWLNHEGKRILKNSVPIHEAYLQETSINHPWVFTDENNNCLGIYSASKKGVSNIAITNNKPTLNTRFFIGKIINKNTNHSLHANVKIVSLENTDTIRAHSNGHGEFSVQLKEGNYQFLFYKKTFLNYHETVEITKETHDKIFKLTPINYSDPILLEEIHFDQGKSKILSISEESLNKLCKMLKDNPLIHIRIDGHTDNQDTHYLNLALSEERAKAIKTYLVQKGINADRLSTKGYGGKKPIASNKTEETRKLNRRVEIVILEK